MDETLWDKRKTAQYLGISVKTIDRWIYENRGPRGLTFGVQVRFRPTDVQAYLESCSTVGGGAVAEENEARRGGARLRHLDRQVLMYTDRIIVPELRDSYKQEFDWARKYLLELAVLAKRAAVSSDPHEIRLALAVVQRQGATVRDLLRQSRA